MFKNNCHFKYFRKYKWSNFLKFLLYINEITEMLHYLCDPWSAFWIRFAVKGSHPA
jgi:hypothetical protein